MSSRVNVYKQRGSWATALRLVGIDIPNMEELGLPKSILENLADNKRGLILVTGHTGSGKSTTLATMIDYINQNRYEHIQTGAAIGMVTMETYIARHYKEGKISLETAYQYAQNRDELKRIIGK